MANNLEDKIEDVELNLETVKKRAVKGVVILTGRTFFLNLVSFFATALLTFFLEPSQFGIFWIVSALVNFLSYFSDIGLAAALIQKKDKIRQEDLSTTFLVQQGLVLIILLTIFLANPILVRFYHLDFEGKLLLYVLGISLFLSSLKTIPSVLLERDLEFGKLVIPQILENLTYNLLAVFLAWRGFGVRSFTYSVLARGIVGLLAIYVLKPWRPKIYFSKESFKNLIGFGLPYQVNTLLATVKDDGLNAVLGGILGGSGFGFLAWAQKWGQAPLRFFMDQVIKVTFPAFSRMQDDKEQLRSSLERSIFFISLFVFPSLFGLLALAPILVQVIPKYLKWQPAIIPLYLIGVNTLFAAVSTQLTNLLNAVGKIKITFKLMVMWTVLSWLIIPFLSIKFGVNGAALGYLILGLSSVVVFIIVRNFLPFSFSRSFLKPLLASLLMFLVLVIFKSYLPVKFVSVLILILLGVLVYFVSIYILVGSLFKEDVKKSFEIFFGKRK
ncbi:MAG: lipopolysaccharide biosynthesis protein [Patescibacteria group bacterium]|nr:MAG: lipopolysaccharide biosynthesis protein [Patescibacteria group bacterium]